MSMPKGKELVEWTVLTSNEIFQKRLNLKPQQTSELLDPSGVQIIMPRTMNGLRNNPPEANGAMWRGLLQAGATEDVLKASYYDYLDDSLLTIRGGYRSPYDRRGFQMEIGVFNALNGRDDIATAAAAWLSMEIIRHNFRWLPEEKPLGQEHWRATASAQLKDELLTSVKEKSPILNGKVEEVVDGVVYDPKTRFSARGALILMNSADALEFCFNQQFDAGLRNFLPRDFKREVLLGLGKQVGLEIDNSNVQEFIKHVGLNMFHKTTEEVAQTYSLPTSKRLLDYYLDSSIPERIAGDIK